jgi:Ring finger domain
MEDRENLLAMYAATLAPDPYEHQPPFVPPESELYGVYPQRILTIEDDMDRILISFYDQDDDEPLHSGTIYDDRLLEFVPDPADPEDVATLQVLTLEDETYRCCVCLEPQDAGDVHLGFRCGHVLHEACSRKWFEYGKTCPLCRGTPWHKEIPAADIKPSVLPCASKRDDSYPVQRRLDGIVDDHSEG